MYCHVNDTLASGRGEETDVMMENWRSIFCREGGKANRSSGNFTT